MAFLDASDEGRDFTRTIMSSSAEITDEWFENEAVKIAITRFASEMMISPYEVGTGNAMFFASSLHTGGYGLVEGGSGIREKLIGIAPVGCAVIAYDYWDFDVTEAAHGRVPAVATGIKRSLPDRIVFGYQGDGDLGAIGTAEIIHAANRGENITIIFVNNTVYGMTGGQMAPTTLLKQKTATTQSGRDKKLHGFPLKVCELLSVLPGVVYAERVTIHFFIIHTLFKTLIKTESSNRRKVISLARK